MKNHELCPTCKSYGECLFKKTAESIAQKVPPLEHQAQIMPTEKATAEASNAHREISLYRKLASIKECPNVDLINPDYPGKNNL